MALICPWASRTLIGRSVKGLEDAVSVSVVDPEMSPQGWRFGAEPDELNGARYLHEIYTRADPVFTGRATVPVLWDTVRNTIVSNESADILRMFNSGFGDLADGTLDLYPADLRDAIDALNERIYPKLNNGVYRAGFATTQVAYDEAFEDVFDMLDELERRLADGRAFLFGERFTEADIRLFVTLVPLRRGLSRPVQVQPAAYRGCAEPEPLSRPRAGRSGRARNREHRPHQARLLFDQGAQTRRVSFRAVPPCRRRWPQSREPQAGSVSRRFGDVEPGRYAEKSAITAQTATMPSVAEIHTAVDGVSQSAIQPR